MAATKYYIDYENGSDTTGDGLSPSTAYKTAKKLIDTETWDSTNGIEVIMSGSALDVLTESLTTTLTTNSWSPVQAAHLTFRGESGSSTGFDGDATYGIITSGSNISFYNLELTNTGSATILNFSAQRQAVSNCYIHGTTGIGVTNANVVNCHSYNIGGDSHFQNCWAYFCFCDNYNGTNHSTYVIRGADNFHNRILMYGGANNELGIYCNQDYSKQFFNTVLCPSGVGTNRTGIRHIGSVEYNSIYGNLVVAENQNTSDRGIWTSETNILMHNAVYNWTTDYDFGVAERYQYGNEVLSSNPFTTNPTGSTNDLSAWEPDVVTGDLDSIRSDTYFPSFSPPFKGSWQPVGGGAGGGGLLRVNMNGNVFG